jgi:hypothetical protein
MQLNVWMIQSALIADIKTLLQDELTGMLRHP